MSGEGGKGAAPAADPAPTEAGNVMGQAFVNGTGLVYTTLVGIGFRVFIARTLGAEGVGLYSLAMAVCAFSALLYSMGAGQTINRFLPACIGAGQPERARRLLWITGGIMGVVSVVLSALLFAGGANLAVRLFEDPGLPPYMPWVAGLLLVKGAIAYLGCILRGLRQVAKATIIGAFGQFTLKVLLSVLFVSLGWGLHGYFLADALSGIAAVVLLVFAARAAWKGTRFSPERKPLAGAMLPFALAMFGLTWLGFGASQGDKLMLGALLPASAIGVYATALSVGLLLPSALAATNSILGPTLAEAAARGDRTAIADLFGAASRWVLLVTLPLAIVCLAFGRNVLAVFGPEFVVGYPVLVILVVAQLWNVATGPVGTTLVMTGGERAEILASALGATVTIAGYAVAIPRWGAEGASASLGAGIFVSNLYRLLVVKRRMGLSPFSRAHLAMILPTGAAVAVALAVRAAFGEASGGLSCLVVGTAAVGAVYGLIAWKWGLSAGDLAIAREVAGKVRRRLRPGPGGTAVPGKA